MKSTRFNKIGDTSYRVKNQINGYISFADWFLNTTDRSMNSFVQWAHDNGVYEYRAKKLSYFNFVLLNAIRRYKVIKLNDNGEYIQNFSNNNPNDDILNNLTSIEGLTNKTDIDTCCAFKAMLDFMIQNRDLNDAHKIFAAFTVFEQGDNFETLYNKENIFSELANMEFAKYSNHTEILKKNFLSKKPSRELRDVCSRLLNNRTNFALTPSEYEALKRSYLWSFSSANDFNTFVNNNDMEIVIKQIIANKIENLLNKEYIDLFNRVLWGLNLSPFSGRNVTNYLNQNINKVNNLYSVKPRTTIERYPYSVEQTNTYLKNIQERDFEFMNNDVHLVGLRRPTIAEYFVNIKFCYLYGIQAKDITKYVNTNLTNDFYPRSCATGFKSDMNYYAGDKLYGVETTLHTTVSSIIDHECRGCIDHLKNFVPVKINNILILVQWKDSDPELVNHFTRNGNWAFEQVGRKFKLLTYDFKQVAELTTI